MEDRLAAALTLVGRAPHEEALAEVLLALEALDAGDHDDRTEALHGALWRLRVSPELPTAAGYEGLSVA